MPNSCFSRSGKAAVNCHPIAYQLIVTHCGTDPVLGGIRQMSGNSAIQGSTSKNAPNAPIAVDSDFAEIWLG
jgi:hypothetical protein